jgi:hypothetical protein
LRYLFSPVYKLLLNGCRLVMFILCTRNSCTSWTFERVEIYRGEFEFESSSLRVRLEENPSARKEALRLELFGDAYEGIEVLEILKQFVCRQSMKLCSSIGPVVLRMSLPSEFVCKLS